MSMIAVPAPPSAALQRDREACASDYSLRRADSRSVALPSIRQAIPELQLATNPERQRRQPYPNGPGWANSGPTGSSDYIHSPSTKKKRISHELENEPLHSYQVPYLYPSPERHGSSHISPVSQHPPTADNGWRSQAPAHYRPSMSASPEFPRRERRPSIHTLPPTPGLEVHSVSHLNRSPVFSSRHGDCGNRYHAVPAPSARAEERSPSRYGMHDGSRYNEMGMMGMGRDTKHRKRRGNLPKETTDKLRSWFVAHLQHPYPTEDEKQDLIRQTGLQMNQISNWFINARRRQLPAMINNARAGTDTMHSRAGVDAASVSSTDVDAGGPDRESTYDASPRMRGVSGLKLVP